MAFTLFVKAETGDTEAKIKGIETGLNKATAAAGQTRDAMGRFTAGAGAAGQAGAAAGQQTAAGHNAASAAANSHGDSLQNLIHLTEAYIGLHVVESVVDGYVEIRNKTNSVATSTANLNALMEEQFRIAQETRSSWEGLASTYQRISNASRSLGLSQRQVIDLTEELSMGLRLSGSSSFEAMMTMQELTHAFTVGTLTGREYKVMMKDAPALMHELQVVSGKTGPEFAEMGKHGKISAELLIEWFGKAKETIRDKFGQTIPTIAEGFILIRNAAQKFFGEAGLGSGVVQGLGVSMKFLADHMEAIGKVTLAVVEAMIGLYVIEKVIYLVRALTVAIAANPLGAILVALTVGIALLRQFGDQIETNQKIWTNVEGQFVTVGDQLYAVWQMMKRLGAAVIDFIDGAWKQLTAAFDNGVNSDGIELSMRNVLTFIASFVDAAIGLFKFLNHSIITVFGGIPVMLTEVFVDLTRAAVRIIQGLVNTVLEGINATIKAYNYVKGLLPGDQGTTMSPDAKKLAAEKWASDMNAKYGITGSIVGEGGQRSAAGVQRAIAEGQHPTQFGFSPGMAPGGSGGTEAANLLKPVDLSFKTPYDDSAKAFLQKFKDDWKNDIEGTNVTKDMVSAFMDGVDKIARDHAAQRVQDAKNKGAGDISTVGGTPDAKLADEKAAKARERLANQLRTITEATNPQADAIEKLAHAHEVLEKAVHASLITQEEADKRLGQYKLKLEDQLHPFEAWIRKQQEAAAALRSTSEEQERAAKLTEFVESMRQKTGGVGVSADQTEAARRQIELGQKRTELMRAEQQFTQSILGPQKTYATQLAALGDLLETNTISSEQYAIEVERVRTAYLAAAPGARTLGDLTEEAWLKVKEAARAAGVESERYEIIVAKVRAQQIAAGPEGKTFVGGMEAAWLKARIEADDFGRTVADQVVGDVNKLSDALVEMAHGGEISWGKMIDSMIADLEKLILKQLEVAAINAIITAATGGVPVPGAGEAIAGGGGGATSDPGIPRIAPTSAYGTATSAISSSARTAAPAASGPVVLHVHNHYDKDVGVQAIASPAGAREIFNQLRANQTTDRRR